MNSRFFFPDTLPHGGEVRIPDALAHHATRVLRMRDGDMVTLFDGAGGEVAARLQARGKAWWALLGEHREVERESPLELVLVQSLASGEKMDWVVQKAVELGVAAILPVESERSVARLSGERALRRVEHWRQVAVAACEQSGRNRVPVIEAVTGLRDYLAAPRPPHHKLVCAPGAQVRMQQMERPAVPIHILVGPEGGWSDSELAAARVAGCVVVALGPRVLRTETAGVAALSAMQALWGDL
ncbi:MAG: 16S rRNA (uracil(1498)-N(3))-methyltransferase [Rhodocyclales bacterium]|nr:16S rRNA (uracil(1498)-N(3))-methyltransferase [Rhodocyclales bacterium]